MPGNTEEKEKCLEKLTRMQKFIPFLDFMIDKIKKKNNELSLDCQLSKFQVLRSMIAEKNGKYSWDIVVKVEDVIEKLIAKLDFKDPFEKPKENLEKKDSQNCKISMATSVSIVPSSTVTTATTTQPKESKPQEFSSSTVDLIMKTLKISVESGMKQHTDRLSNPLGSNQPLDTGKTMETDLDKDLDGFDLTDCSNLSEADANQSVEGVVHEIPEKQSSHDDLLSSSREKLLKSLQSRLLPCKTNRPSSQFSTIGVKTERSSDSQNSSAFGCGQINLGEQKNKSDSENGEQNAADKHNRKVFEAPGTTPSAKQGISKSVVLPEKTRTDPANCSSDVNLKQRLKEKFSTDICEVYRVPGKSVGGSLRSLKDSNDHRKSFNVEEDELSKPSKVLDKGSCSRVSRSSSFYPKRDSLSDKSRRDSPTSEKKVKRSESKNVSTARDDFKSKNQKSESGISDKASHKKWDGKISNDGNKEEKKNLELDKLNDEELLGLVKENTQSLPHLSQLKPSELRKAVQCSLSRSFSQLDSDAVSEISDDSFHDLDDELSTEQKSNTNTYFQGNGEKELHSLACVKIPGGPDGVAKKVKPIVEPTKDTKVLDEVGNKTDDLDNVSCEENFDEEDYAIQLIEETTPRTYPIRKKKGLLELPMPAKTDLFDEISSFESFEPPDASPAESRDSRLTSFVPSEEKNKSCNKTDSNPNLNKTTRYISSNLPTDSSHASKSQTGFGCISAPSDSFKKEHENQERLDLRLDKTLPSRIPQDGSQPQFGNRHLNESMFRNSSSYFKSSINPSRDPRRHSCSSEPKSYAEYKRLKQKEQERLQQSSKECLKNTSDGSNLSGPSQLATNNEDTDRHGKKNQDFRHKGQNNSKSSIRTQESRKNSSHSNQRKYSDISESRSWEERRTLYEESKKDEKRHSVDFEELVSPLEELYRNENKPKTGRGYGIQNFKIPKKVLQGSSKPSQTASVKSTIKPQSDTENAKKSLEMKESVKSDTSQVQSTKVEDTTKPDVTQADTFLDKDKINKTESTVKTDSSIRKDEASGEKTIQKNEFENPTVAEKAEGKTNGVAKVIPKIDGNKTDTLLEVAKAVPDLQTITYPKDVESSKQCEAQIIECDSSIDSSSLHETNSGKESATSGDKTTVVQKEEITQEFVEALIRKSFQSGEGKLLLAQVKLFEEFTRKLNSKKRKTIQKIQKIINSDSGSSSSSEASSGDEKKMKKGKKSEPKSKKRKKRGKKIRKQEFSSSSSSSSCSYSSYSSTSSEGEETSDEEKKGRRKTRRKKSTDEAKVKDSPLPTKTRTQKKRMNVELRKQLVEGRSKRQQIQKKLLEEILKDPQQGGDHPNLASKDSDTIKRKTKTKGKTELDRLHEDIRSMFISDGVLTATGHRMCRILKQSGGNMKNLDIVKESAKMVEEEKLKRVQTRKSLKNSSGGSESRSRSQSLDKGAKAREEDQQDSKLKLEPRVVLQRVDLDNFGYGVKISEGCLSFRRMQGRNTAIKGKSSAVSNRIIKGRNSRLAKNVFLLRNKRKFEFLRDSNRKKSYRGKKLMDVVKNLPLKMAKMKHLQIFENKTGEKTTKKKEDFPKKIAKITPQGQQKVEISNIELLNYAYEKKRRIYPCKLCSFSTRSITGHYRAVHPEHEIIISRLCVNEAEQAKKESEKNNYDLKVGNLNLQVKRKVKKFRRSEGYDCRMCPLTKMADINTFASHVSTHTGEFRFQCPAEGCPVRVFSREQMKFHILTKHSKNRYEFYNQIKELYPLVVENDILFGFLCSQCHYVQIGRENMENHLLRQHENYGEIIKINMSSEKIKKKTVNTKSGSKEESLGDNNGEEETKEGEDESEEVDEESQEVDEENRKMSEENREVQATSWKDVEIVNKKKKYKCSLGSESDIELVKSKKIFLEEKTGIREGSEKPEITEKCDVRLEKDDLEEEEEEEEEEKDKGKENGDDGDDDDDDDDDDGDGDGDDDDDDDDDDDEKEKNTENNLCDDVDVEDCVDLKNISALKGSDIIESEENLEMREIPVKNNSEVVERLKVGPLEAVLLQNSKILYECYIKGCLFSTRVFDLFEKHIKISHWKTKWDGICKICGNGKDTTLGENSFQLLTALKHLKLHERGRTSNGKLSTEDLITELKLFNPSEECVVDDEESSTADERKLDSEVKGNKTQAKSDTETPFPPKPLLRVRNLLGDRLSTPKADENEVIAINEEEETSTAEPPADSSMFTIENVRSLTEAPTEEKELKIEKVCSLKELILKPASQLTSGKTIIVRSCPTRKIAIRPEPSTLPVDVGQISVVQPPVVAHPVVLSPISTTSPIRIISAALSPKPQYTVKPVVLAADTVRLSSPNVIPVIRPSLSPNAMATTIVPVSANAETIAVPHKSVSHEYKSAETENINSKSSLEVEVISPSRSKSPSSGGHPLPRSSPSDAEEAEEDTILPPSRFPSSPNSGKKSVKDAKIYQEMLTKKKLCHLFKCMGIECSFTCNDENVFTQHIGLHEAQRRLKKNKGVKTIVLKSANKKTRAFYWQQCAYCCEVLTSSNKALGNHIYQEHGHCIYQCGFCFYRAVSHSYVEIHQNLAHTQVLKTTPRVIYKCKSLKMPPSQAAALEKHGKKQSVRPYQCDQCGKKFFITHEFTSHLATQHQSVTAYTCHICKNLCFKVNRLINHYKMHSYSTYQCAYCLHGTETEKEMVFHLCNFHFSQPAIMYVRTLIEGQSDDEKEKPIKKKRHLSNQLDSLKVIIYESDTTNSDSIVEADPEEEISESATEASLDLSDIVAELGIYTGAQSTSTEVTPLMKELAFIGDKTNRHLTVKSLLPNAQFSSENESGSGENCSVLISSGLSIPSDPNNEREMSIPLGQLPLETVNVQHKKTPPPLPNSSGSYDKNPTINEIVANLQHKDTSFTSPNEEMIGQSSTVVLSSAVHKLPPVVLGRSSATKSAYPSKSTIARKKSEDSTQNNENTGNKKSNVEGKAKNLEEKTQKTPNEKSTSGKPVAEDPLTTKSIAQILTKKVVNLSNLNYEKESCPSADKSISFKDSSEVVPNVLSKVNSSSVLKPPIIRVEDFPLDEQYTTPKESTAEPEHKDITQDADSESQNKKNNLPSSPDIIILEDEKTTDIETVTLDSDDEKDENGKKKKDLKNAVSCAGNETIRKEMELLRKQIASETDSLLVDETQSERKTDKLTRDLTLNLEPRKNEEDPNAKILSPIEEAICSLNKKLESETKEAQKREKEEKKEKVEESPKKTDILRMPERPRTRFGAKDNKKDDKIKKFKEELEGKELFICGNEKCNFAGDDDSALKDHLYVCDLSRESSVLVCPHCSRQIKQFHPYLEHLKYHGKKRYHCGLCEFSSAVDASVSRHVKQKHKCTVIKILPKESQEGHLLYYPKNYKVEKIDFEVNGYSPGDEDKLPLQSVYQVNVKCAKCPYFTKVRSNMVRHLKIHLKSVETEGVVVVPSTAPTNPVPCLETKERMFDKMTNLAASSQLAQAKEKTALENLPPEEEAKLPQFVTEQMRYKCCLPDCNYITVDDGMLKHHIKALHDEINYYSCPHCRSSVHVDVRHVTLDKIGFHLKHHDSKLYKCAHCIYFHYQKNSVEKHTIEKHPDRRYFVYTIREPKLESTCEEEPSSNDGGARVWKCGLCDDFQTPSKSTLMEHMLKSHNTKSKYKCQLCPMKGNTYQVVSSHFASKHIGEKISYLKMYYSDKVSGALESGNSSGADSSNEYFDTTPLWQRGVPRIRHIRGILIEEEEIKAKKSKKIPDETGAEMSDMGKMNENAFYCPLCTNKKKPFYTRNEDCFRTHLYQELNYQQFACILCGKMFVDRKDFDRHHAKFHVDKPQALKHTKEDHEIKFWVDQVIAKRKKQMEERKRKISDSEESGSQGPPKKKKEG